MPVGNGLALASAFLMPALLNNIGASDSSMAHATGAGDVDDVEPNGGRGEDELSYLENNRIKGHTEAVFKLGLAVRQPPPFLSLSPVGSPRWLVTPVQLSSEQASCVAGVLIATKRLLPLIEKLAAEVESGSESLPRVLHNNRVELGNWMRSIEQYHHARTHALGHERALMPFCVCTQDDGRPRLGNGCASGLCCPDAPARLAAFAWH